MLHGMESCDLYKKDSRGNNIIVKLKKNPPTNIEDIGTVERQIKLLIPKQYIEFLLFSNGMELYNYDNIDGLKLLSLQEIEMYTAYSRNTFEEDWQDNILIFGKIIGEDNYLGFKIYEEYYEIVDCYFEQLPSEWETIDGTFDGFLTKYLTGNGNKYWIS